MSFETRRFDLELPETGGISMGLIGASRSGKTTLLKHLYKTFFKKHITLMTTMNPHADIYKDMGDKMLVASTFHPELLRDIHEINKLTDNKYDFLFISDDYVDTKIKNDPEITRALTIYRNAGLSSIFSFQGRTLMSAVSRNNLHYVAILKQQTPKDWKAVIEEFLDMWLPMDMTMREKIDFCQKATMDHQMFFVDNLVGCCYLTKLSSSQVAHANS
jgi:ABC-type cobalamin/Fe3+-siderophores transport system ATPase subunit